MTFCHCHAHTTYSALDGYGTAEQWAEHVKHVLKHDAHALTDHGVITAHAPLAKAFKAAGIKPVFGLEAYVVDDHTDRTKGAESVGANSFPHVTLLALNQEGYANLVRLHNISWRSAEEGGGFYYKPRMDWGLIRDHARGLAVLSGCPMGYPTRILEKYGEEECEKWLRWVGATLQEHGAEFYVELVPSPDYDVSVRTLGPLMLIARRLGLPTILTGDAHFPAAEDHPAEDALLAAGIGDNVVMPRDRRKMCLDAYYYAGTESDLTQRALKTIKKWGGEDGAAKVSAVLAESIIQARLIGAKADVELPRAAPVRFWGFKTVTEQGPPTLLRRWAEKGLMKHGKLDDPVYRERMDKELDVLTRKGFCDYMLVVIDLIRELRSRGALVITRGSAGGSLLLWACGASVTDPIKHDLSFERFFDNTRDDPPDVDIDFSTEWRGRAIAYLYEKYGEGNCAQIANFNTLGAKAAVKLAARALGLDGGEAELLSSAISSSSDNVGAQLAGSADPRVGAILARSPTLVRLASLLIGQVQNQGIHAAGVLVSSEKLDGKVGLMRGAKGQVVASLDKRGAKQLGYLKVDVLLVDTLGVLERCLRRLGKDVAWLENLPLDDTKTLELARRGRLAGIFQLDGAAAWRVANEISIDTFADLAMASALCRPGPADWVPLYAARKGSRDLLRECLKGMDRRAALIVLPTFGLVVTQEQVMRLAWDLAGLEDKDVHQLRRDIGDKLGTQPDLVKRAAWKSEWRRKWTEGCAAQGVSEQEAVRWWEQIEEHGGYSFNKSHCWTYALVGYWMLYLKAHHPAIFYEAYLTGTDDTSLIDRLLVEFKQDGGQVELLDPTAGRRSFHSKNGVLYGGWCQLAGQGEAGFTKVGRGQYKDWDELLAACTPTVRAKLDAARSGDSSALLQIAPWYPTAPLPDYLEARRNLLRMVPLRRLAQVEGDVSCYAYVSNTAFSAYRLNLMLKDETGPLGAAVPKSKVKTAVLMREGKAVPFRTLKRGDLVAIKGRMWQGTLYINDIALYRPATEVSSGKKTLTLYVPRWMAERIAGHILQSDEHHYWFLEQCLRIAHADIPQANRKKRRRDVDTIAYEKWAKGDWFSGRKDMVFDLSAEQTVFFKEKSQATKVSDDELFQRVIRFGYQRLTGQELKEG